MQTAKNLWPRAL